MQAPFINKKINKEIMKRSRLRNKFLNTKNDIDKKAYNKQRNLCVSLIKSATKNFSGNINASDIIEIPVFKRKNYETLTHKFIPFKTQWFISFTWFGNSAYVSQVIFTEFAWAFNSFPIVGFWFK